MKRYTMLIDYVWADEDLAKKSAMHVEDSNGEWVKYEDVKEGHSLLREVIKKLEEIEDLRGVILCKRILHYLGEDK